MLGNKKPEEGDCYRPGRGGQASWGRWAGFKMSVEVYDAGTAVAFQTWKMGRWGQISITSEECQIQAYEGS